MVILGQTGSYEGSGGSSDFTSATVTFVLGNNLKSFQFEGVMDYPQYNEDTSNQLQYNFTEVFGNTNDPPSTATDIESNQSLDIILYQGEAYIKKSFVGGFDPNEKTSTSFTLSGNAEVVTEGDFADYILVTGDCTITVDWTT